MNDITKDLLEALKMATLQNRLDMVMTGDEIRKCETAIARAEAALAAPQPDALKDSDRLDAIQSMVRASGTGVSFDWCRHVEDGRVAEKGYRMMWRRELGPREPDIRQAIDAAMGWKRPQGELE